MNLGIQIKLKKQINQELISEGEDEVHRAPLRGQNEETYWTPVNIDTKSRMNDQPFDIKR